MDPRTDTLSASIDGPSGLLGAWPADRPLAMLAWYDDVQGDRAFAASPTERIELHGPRTLPRLRTVLSRTSAARTARDDSKSIHGPSGRGFFVMLGYDLFRQVEETAVSPSGAIDDRHWPDAILLRCEGGVLLSREGVVHRGDPGASPPLTSRSLPDAHVGPVNQDRSAETYQRMVSEVVERIRRGDCFQANISHRFTAGFQGSARTLADAAFATARPRHGALLECGSGRAIVSMSPELFLEARRHAEGLEILTRPIKGTRPANVAPEELLESEKDAAELAMIVDLMRNDLGRVCEIGSISVVQGRRIESHPTVHHGVAEIRGVLRSDADLVDLLEASFPPGSITGAPKVQAMRIIDELEPTRRGPYCGAIGWIDDNGTMSLNVAIRTICCTGLGEEGPGEIEGRLDYHAGCGIVADSDPESEYRESLDKAEVFRRTLRMLTD